MTTEENDTFENVNDTVMDNSEHCDDAGGGCEEQQSGEDEAGSSAGNPPGS